MLAAIVRSRREDPEWQEAIQRWYLAKNRQIVAEGQAKMAAAARAAVATRKTQSQDVLDISFQGWKSRNAVKDAGQASSVNSIHERTTYVEPGGTSVDLPSYYQNVYTDGRGNYILHDDSSHAADDRRPRNGMARRRSGAPRPLTPPAPRRGIA